VDADEVYLVDRFPGVTRTKRIKDRTPLRTALGGRVRGGLRRRRGKARGNKQSGEHKI
jgi:hypothetical protein